MGLTLRQPSQQAKGILAHSPVSGSVDEEAMQLPLLLPGPKDTDWNGWKGGLLGHQSQTLQLYIAMMKRFTPSDGLVLTERSVPGKGIGRKGGTNREARAF